MAALNPDLPMVEVTMREQWRDWLAANHRQPTGVWVVTRKKAAIALGHPYVSPADLSEECLCYGWVDSKPGKVDAERSPLLCTPRKAGSGWSQLNKSRIERLLAAGQVADAGLEVIAAAQRDGSWSKLDLVDALVEPSDLSAALEAIPGARSNWDAFPPSTRRGILEWILQAKRPETRTNRIEQTATLAGINERANQWRGRGG